ncbi:surface antigen, putative [Bodo saltans]|uniref:Surface antigen, putative n=1 Tax=Bodo saltans TaxID=75058 RepID=A0A0S4JEG9_BODSA|nr:surface antigen, putative [Bodo saltans]|eukprot:CUG88564.1 surface antigen, putative [Bodo saltans]
MLRSCSLSECPPLLVRTCLADSFATPLTPHHSLSLCTRQSRKVPRNKPSRFERFSPTVTPSHIFFSFPSSSWISPLLTIPPFLALCCGCGYNGSTTTTDHSVRFSVHKVVANINALVQSHSHSRCACSDVQEVSYSKMQKTLLSPTLISQFPDVPFHHVEISSQNN